MRIYFILLELTVIVLLASCGSNSNNGNNTGDSNNNKGYDIERVHDFHQGLAVMIDHNSYPNYGYINEQNDIVIPPQYYYACDFDENGMALVFGQHSKCGLINTQGDTVVPIQNLHIQKIGLTQYFTKRVVDYDTILSILDFGEEIKEIPIQNPEYDLEWVNNDLRIKYHGNYGLIGLTSGIVSIPFIFDELKEQKNGYTVVKKNGLYGIWSSRNGYYGKTMALDCKYQDIKLLTEEYAIVQDSTKMWKLATLLDDDVRVEDGYHNEFYPTSIGLIIDNPNEKNSYTIIGSGTYGTRKEFKFSIDLKLFDRVFAVSIEGDKGMLFVEHKTMTHVFNVYRNSISFYKTFPKIFGADSENIILQDSEGRNKISKVVNYTVGREFEKYNDLSEYSDFKYVDKNQIIAQSVNNQKWGVIDEKKNIIIPFIYEEIENCFNYNKELYVVAKLNDKWGVASSNSVYIPFDYESIDCKHYISGIDAVVLQNGMWGFVGQDNKTILPFRYTKLSSVNSDLFCAEEDGQLKYINRRGTTLFPNKNPKIKDITAISEGYAVVQYADGTYGYYQIARGLFTTGKYKMAKPFNHGIALVGDDISTWNIDVFGHKVGEINMDVSNLNPEHFKWDEEAARIDAMLIQMVNSQINMQAIKKAHGINY